MIHQLLNQRGVLFLWAQRAALPILIGLQFILAFLGYDIASVPKRALHKKFRNRSSINRKRNS